KDGILDFHVTGVQTCALPILVDGYAPVVAGLQNDIDEIETQVFNRDPRVSRRIYELLREVIEFQRAASPLLGILADLEAGFDKYGTGEELQRDRKSTRLNSSH